MSHISYDGDTPMSYEDWFRSKVGEALENTGPTTPPSEVMFKLRNKVAADPLKEQVKRLVGPNGAGVKHDEGKLPYDLIPPELLASVAKVLQFGAKKYAPRNWEKGMDWGRVFSALQRHLWAWQSKEEADPETGFSHLEHAACCIAFLVAYEQRGVGKDDR